MQFKQFILSVVVFAVMIVCLLAAYTWRLEETAICHGCGSMYSTIKEAFRGDRQTPIELSALGEWATKYLPEHEHRWTYWAQERKSVFGFGLLPRGPGSPPIREILFIDFERLVAESTESELRHLVKTLSNGTSQEVAEVINGVRTKFNWRAK